LLSGIDRREAVATPYTMCGDIVDTYVLFCTVINCCPIILAFLVVLA
jgi:hypothetical protein